MGLVGGSLLIGVVCTEMTRDFSLKQSPAAWNGVNESTGTEPKAFSFEPDNQHNQLREDAVQRQEEAWSRI